jgi:ABC-type bacteriocin/lantibiotic exporter with double-glycine peptidase domain
MAKVFKTIIWPRRNIILLGFVLIIISRLSAIVLPYSVKPIIDDIIGKGDMSNLKLILIGCLPPFWSPLSYPIPSP